MTDRDLIHSALTEVRRRWRLRLAVEALVPVLIGAALALVVWSLAWPFVGTRPGVVLAARWLAAAAVVGAVFVAALRWIRRRPSDLQVALYVEERAPALGQSLVSSISEEEAAPGLMERVRSAARSGLAAIDDGRSLERDRLRRAGGMVGALTLGSVALIAFGPAGFREATTTLVNPWKPVATAPAFFVDVSPGNAEIPKGGGVDIAAELNGFSSELAEMVFRTDSTAEWERLPMSRDTAVGRFTTRLFDVAQATEYFVESEGIRSPTYRLAVVDLPAVERTDALISYPPYTGVAPESIEEAGDLVVLEGSTVRLSARTTRPARSAVLVVEGRDPVPMTATDGGGWTGAVRIAGDTFWRIDLESEDGRRITGLQYAIDAIEDQAPVVRFAAPGRDTKASSIEEVTADIRADDDYGVRQLTLKVSVNGGAEQTVALTDSTARAIREVSAAHTFFLEEYQLTPGDLVSYYAEATDGAGHTGKSDIYFLEIRPFDKNYRQAEAGGGGGGGGGEGSAEGLSERQRQIVVGTFNVLRDSASQGRRFREDVTTLAIGEGRLREEVDNLKGQMRRRQMAGVDSTFVLIAAALDSAAGELRQAEENLGRQQPRNALQPAQRALQHLQRAEAAYRDVQVSQGGGGGGGGGGQQSNAEDLADLFELETDKLRNQYESVQRESGEQAERQLDETVERLRQLASRQQQENERMQRRADAMQNRAAGGGGGGNSQRQLADEAEEAARQLERLARERNDASMADAARRLRDAAEQMRRAAATNGQNSQSGASQGNSALEQLRSATRDLERARSEGRQDEIRRLQARADELRDKQEEIARQATSLPANPGQRAERIEALGERKDALARDVDRLEADAERLARDAAREQPQAARKLNEAAEGLRTSRVRDKLTFSKSLLQRGSAEYVRTFEEGIGENLAEAAERLRAASGSLQESAGNRQSQALERARDLVRGLESLNERARAAQRRADEQGQTGQDGQRQAQDQDQQRQGQEGRQGQDQQRQGQQGGQQGQEGQQGRQGQQSQAGQQGQSGQQGQRGQEGQEGQQGQGGQQGQRGQPTGAMDGTPGGRFDNDGTRQFTREFRARRQAAESLRADLRALGEETGDLDRLLERFRSLDNQETFGDARGLDRLQSDLIDGLKELEFALWRRFGDDGSQRPAAGASARVPAQYRDLVEEYYRSLARQKPPKP